MHVAYQWKGKGSLLDTFTQLTQSGVDEIAQCQPWINKPR